MSGAPQEVDSQLDWLNQASVERLAPIAARFIHDAASNFIEPVEIVKIHWFGPQSRILVPKFGVGGFSYAYGEISLAWDDSFKGDADYQMKQLRSTVFHEYFHQMQGYVAVDENIDQLGPIAVAVYEGCAIVFERYANDGLQKKSESQTNEFGDEFRYDDIVPFLPEIIEKVRSIDGSDEWDYQSWKFNHPLYGRYVLYKLGSYIIDEVLQANPQLSITDLVKVKWQDIISMSGI